MPDHRTQGLSADLFTTAADMKAPPEAEAVAPKVDVAPTAEPASPRHLLPKDLPGALARLSDSELDKLLAAAIDEAKKRERLPSSLVAKSREAGQASHDAPPSRQSNAGDVPSSLTRGQLRAVRAAFKAGVKPSAIARQFRISQSDVRKVIAADARDHKFGL